MINQNKIWATVAIACLLVAALVVPPILSLRVHVYRESEEIKAIKTYKLLIHAARSCDQYKAQHGVWPTSLDAVDDAWVWDGWGRKIIFVPCAKSSAYGEVISYGRDGKPGGVGLNREIVIRYPVEANVAWNKGQTNELLNPFGIPLDYGQDGNGG